MRYEKKYKFKKGLGRCLSNFLICNKFREAYPKRVISSLYYDNFNYKNYFDSINGIGARSKLRIRFYDNNSNDSQIEIKKKFDELGEKIFPDIEKTNFDKLYNLKFPSEFNISGKNKFPGIINNEFRPIVFVKYNRRYFISESNEIRITIDTSIKFSAAIFKNNYIFIDYPRNLENSVLELKFEDSQIFQDDFLDRLANNFDLSLDRSSKYCDAIEIIYNI